MKTHAFAPVLSARRILCALFRTMTLAGLITIGMPADAQVVIEAFDAEGNLSGQVVRTVPAEERIIGLLNEDIYFGPQFNQIGGHIRISSDSQVVVFALFGDFAQQFLSAIEAQDR